VRATDRGRADRRTHSLVRGDGLHNAPANSRRRRAHGARRFITRDCGSALREGLHLTAPGLVIGGALSLVAARGLRSLLFGVTPTDLRTYVGVVMLLGVASLIACYLPAYRAGHIDPMRALRED
jgi:putative ABC transport system permease protein